MPWLTQNTTLHFSNSHWILKCVLSTLYILVLHFAVTSTECFLHSQMPFDLNGIGKDWEVPRIKNNSKYLEKYKLFQVYGQLRVGRECGIMQVPLRLYNNITFTSSYLWVNNSGLTNLRPFSITCKNIQLTKTWSDKIQPNFNKVVKKK